MTPVGKIEAFGPWTAPIEAMDAALAANDTGEAIRAWRLAYSAALSHPGWLGLFTVATASLRIGTSPSLARGAPALTQETYWIAFFRARQQRSISGIRCSAEAFAMLGDRDSAERCLRLAEKLEASACDTSEAGRAPPGAPPGRRLEGLGVSSTETPPDQVKAS